ncbi:MAG: sodium/proline symporter, partial [Clostridia bacterium]|nr:sodium/proline symporter [Clostridia bacterium]
AVFVLLYTLLGGFLAESASDFMQSIVMIIALVAVVGIGVVNAGGFGAVFENAKTIPGFLDFFGLATPVVENGVQVVEAGKPVFGEVAPYGILSICSMLAWGLGYFGMPQVLLRFMAIREEGELKRSRRIAMVWVIISLAVAVFIGITGRVIAMNNPEVLSGELLLTKSSAENIFIQLSTSFLPPIIAGFVMAGILAATISSSDSYLLIAASAVAKNIYQGVAKKNASDKSVMLVSRITLLVIALIAMFLAFDENSVIFQIVSFAWAGFGATFGPIMLFSLFWKRTTRAGAVAGMVSGAAMVFIWKLGTSTLGGAFAIYELLPAFIFSAIVIVVVSLLTPAPSKEIEEDFDSVCAK